MTNINDCNIFYIDNVIKRGVNKMLSLKEVAKRLDLHYNTIYAYVQSGELKAIKFKKVYRIEEQELDKFIKDKKFKIQSKGLKD